MSKTIDKVLINEEFTENFPLAIFTQIIDIDEVDIIVRDNGLPIFVANCKWLAIEPQFLSIITINRKSNVDVFTSHEPFTIRIIQTKEGIKGIISRLEV